MRVSVTLYHLSTIYHLQSPLAPRYCHETHRGVSFRQFSSWSVLLEGLLTKLWITSPCVAPDRHEAWISILYLDSFSLKAFLEILDPDAGALKERQQRQEKEGQPCSCLSP